VGDKEGDPSSDAWASVEARTNTGKEPKRVSMAVRNLCLPLSIPIYIYIYIIVWIGFKLSYTYLLLPVILFFFFFFFFSPSLHFNSKK